MASETNINVIVAVTVTPSLHFEVSRRIREEFDNGKHYYELHCQKIIVPGDPSQRPDSGALRWHNEQCFKGVRGMFTACPRC